MLVRGNTKLGPDIWSFSVPALLTCPGASKFCKSICYATRGHYIFASVKESHRRNRKATLTRDFVSAICMEIRLHRIRILRVHAAGDFENAAVIRKWIEIVRRSGRTQFFAYTRSWVKKDLFPLLCELGAEPNMQLHWSEDHSMPRAPEVPGIPPVWVAKDDNDVPDHPVKIVFRDKDHTVLKRMGPDRSLVCPVEQGVARQWALTCSSCRVCFTRRPERGQSQNRPQTVRHSQDPFRLLYASGIMGDAPGRGRAGRASQFAIAASR